MLRMKYVTGQQVTLLDTEYKPAGTAIIQNYQEQSHKYEVAYLYPDAKEANLIFVPEERLILPTEVN